MKRCRACGVEKPLDQFHKSPNTKDGRQSRCKECAIEVASRWQRDNRQRLNETRRKRYHGEKHDELREKTRGQERRRRQQADPEWRARRREIERKSFFRRKYGITVEEYDALAAEQRGVCAICGEAPSGRTRYLHVDHCHDSDVVRGLLCGKCNTGLGLFRESPTLMATAIDYLNRRS